METHEVYKARLDELELLAQTNLDEALEKMIGLYIETHKTYHHDISDSLNVWVFEKGTLATKRYLEEQLTQAPSEFLKSIFQAWIDAISTRQ